MHAQRKELPPLCGSSWSVDHVRSLVELSRDRADDARRELASRLSVFAVEAIGGLSEDETVLLDDILVKLLVHIDATLRMRLADRLAEMAVPPPQLVHVLARDDIGIAARLLHEGALTDPDLIGIARETSVEHRIAIAARPRLAPLVSATLVSQGERAVLNTLLNNRSAGISKASYAEIARAARDDESLQSALVQRPDAPRAMLAGMFWWVAETLRADIAEKLDIDINVVKRQFVDGFEEAFMELQADPVAAAAVNTIRDPNENLGAIVDSIHDAARGGMASVAIAMIGRLGAVPSDVARRIMLDETGEALAVLAKVVGLHRTQFIQMHLALDKLRGVRGRSFNDIERATKLYDRIGWEGADLLLRYWANDRGTTRH